MAMVSCLHLGNTYTKRKLRVWRDQKCIPTVGAITTLTYAGRHNTPSQGRQYRAQNGKLGKLGRIYGHGTVFAPRKYIYQKEATGMERPEIHSVSLCNNHGTVFAQRKYLHQKDATGMERPERYSVSRCNNHTYLCEPS